MADHSVAANVIVGLVFLIPIVVIIGLRQYRKWQAAEAAAEAEMQERLRKDREYWLAADGAKRTPKRVVGRTQK